MTWTEAAPAALAATAVLFLPGVVVGWAAGWRGIAVWGSAPLLSVGIVAAAAVLAPVVGLPWSMVPVAVLTAVSAIAASSVAWVARSAGWTQPQRDGPLVALAALGGLAIGAALGMASFVEGLGRPDALSQTFDASFHYNAVQFAVDEANASSMFVGTLVTPGLEQRFYPAGWHGLVALVVMVAEPDTVLAVTGVSVAIIGLAWPAASMLLVRQLLGPRWAAVLAAGVLSSAFVALPVRMMARGVLWPNALGYVLVPVALAALVALVGLAVRDVLGRTQSLAVLLVAVLALGLSHPNTLFALVVLGTPVVLTASLLYSHREWQGGRRGLALLPWSGLVIAALGAMLLARSSDLLAAVTRFDWPARATVPEAIREVALLATNKGPTEWILAVVLAVGMVAALRTPRLAWLTPTYLLVGLLYVLAVGVDSWLSLALTGPWYNDSFRVAAMLPVVGVPLVIIGLAAVSTLAARAAALLRDADQESLVETKQSIVLVGATVVVVLVTGFGYVTARSEVYRAYYALDPDHDTSRLVTTDEYAMMRGLPDIVPSGVAVAGNPWNGSALTYAIADRPVPFPHLDGAWDQPRQIVAARLRDIAADEEVCAAATQLRIGFVLLSGPALWPDQRAAQYPGLELLDEAEGFDLVERRGETRLYRITACAGGADVLTTAARMEKSRPSWPRHDSLAGSAPGLPRDKSLQAGGVTALMESDPVVKTTQQADVHDRPSLPGSTGSPATLKALEPPSERTISDRSCHRGLWVLRAHRR